MSSMQLLLTGVSTATATASLWHGGLRKMSSLSAVLCMTFRQQHELPNEAICACLAAYHAQLTLAQTHFQKVPNLKCMTLKQLKRLCSAKKLSSTDMAVHQCECPLCSMNAANALLSGQPDGSDRWVRQMGQPDGSDRWGRQVGPTGGSDRWVRQVGQTGGSDRWGRQVGQIDGSAR